MSNLLSFASGLKYFGLIMLTIALILLLIVIHEFGHYIAGKILKFKINEFSIGFGPKIYQKTKKNGELFTLRWLPLGGYCAFDGEDGENPNPDAFTNQKPWKRLIVLFAGPLFNFLGAFVFTFFFLWVGEAQSFAYAFTHFIPYTFFLLNQLLTILGNLFVGKGLNELSGNIYAIKFIADTAQTFSLDQLIRFFLLFIPFLSLNLAVFNLIPFPALDGGQAFFTLIEIVIRRPLNRKVVNTINTVGLFVLLGLIVVLDIWQFVR